jgi:hypothetical protein
MTLFLLAIIVLLLAAILYAHRKHIDALKSLRGEVEVLRSLWEKAIAEVVKRAP